MEHFVTLFDQGFLPQGMALHHSLAACGEACTLWVLCMDQEVERSLRKLALPNLEIVPLEDLEREEPRLLEVKPGRTRVEYCWTLSSFSIAHVMRRTGEGSRVTYVDADVYLFGPPSTILSSMDRTGADVLLTDHGFAPQYEHFGEAGRFCVQFVPFRSTPGGRQILSWWQDRCHEWCHARLEDGKFGDQKYLDDWPERWPSSVMVLDDQALALAPWNLEYRLEGDPRGIYHFHGLRIHQGWRVRLWEQYLIGKAAQKRVYSPYLAVLASVRGRLEKAGITIAFPSLRTDPMAIWRRWRSQRKRTVRWSRV